MKVFITGASGYIGSAVVPELSKAGHQVIGLARSEESAHKIKSLGTNVQVLRGGLDDLDVLKKGVEEAEGIIHLGFVHDFNNYDKCCEIDRYATMAMLESLVGSNKRFVYTGVSLPEEKASSNTAGVNKDAHNLRGITEEIALAFSNKGVRVTCVRLPPTVHGRGDKAFIPLIMAIAKNTGKSGYIAGGQNVWPAISRLDAAHLFKLVLEKGYAGRAYEGAAERGIKTKDIAETIGEIFDVPAVSIPSEEASKHFGTLSIFFSRHIPVSNELTCKELNWEPQGLGLLMDLRQNYCS